MPIPAPFDPAEFFAAMIQWLVKTAITRWFGRRQSPQLSQARAGIMEMQRLFQRLADLIAAGPGALQPEQVDRPQAPPARQAAPRIRPSAQNGAKGEGDIAAWPKLQPQAAPPLAPAEAGSAGITHRRKPVAWLMPLASLVPSAFSLPPGPPKPA